ALLTAIVRCAVAVAGAGPCQEMTGLPGTELIELQSNERQLYPRLEDVAIKAMDRLPEGVGLKLDLVSDFNGFAKFVYSTNGAPFREAVGGRLVIVFEDRHTVDVQKTATIVRAVSASGVTSKDYHINVNYYPKELYAAAGQTAPGYVIVQKTDMPIIMSRVADWIPDQPTLEDVAFATAKWGKVVEGATPPLEKARRLARVLMDELKTHRGTPSDKMEAPPFEQYRRLMSGADRAWCSNLADIFVHACNALGVPARAMKLIRYWSKGAAFDLLMAEGHSTTEIFAADLNKWIWIDLTFQMTGMELPGQGPIHMAELVRALNDPDRAGGLMAIVYDPETKTEKRMRALDSPSLNSLRNYFKPDQTFRYSRKKTS
ncbi:MAG: transglutaminase domain-containing protein, partial [candidate division NC10 bacterium]